MFVEMEHGSEAEHPSSTVLLSEPHDAMIPEPTTNKIAATKVKRRVFMPDPPVDVFLRSKFYHADSGLLQRML